MALLRFDEIEANGSWAFALRRNRSERWLALLPCLLPRYGAEAFNVRLASIYTEHDIPIAEWHTIDAVGIVVILRTGILGEDATEGSSLAISEKRKASGRDFHI